jgi:hypothetical protein
VRLDEWATLVAVVLVVAGMVGELLDVVGVIG